MVGLKLAADDYVVGSFGVHEFLAWVEGLLRWARRRAVGGFAGRGCFGWGGAEVDVRPFAIKVAGHTAMSTARELELAWVFAAHPGEGLSRDRLLKVRRGVDYLGPTRTLDQSMVQLRWKVEVDPKRPVVWVTGYGAGYCLAAGVRGKFRIYGLSRRGIGRKV